MNLSIQKIRCVLCVSISKTKLRIYERYLQINSRRKTLRKYKIDDFIKSIPGSIYPFN